MKRIISTTSHGASVSVAIALGLLRAYKVLISPFFAGSCRYWPSCSDYARDAVIRYGVLRGFWLAARRLGRCHPFGSSGFDPVPEEGRHPSSS